MLTIGDRIKQKRKELGLTQAELGAKINVTDRAVSKWEQNEGNPDMSLVGSLASVLGVSLDYLIMGKEEATISLDDMDDKKRLSWVIKRDDVDNFKKYSYQTSSHIFGREQDYAPNTQYGYNHYFKVTSLNLPTWKEIISNNANKIFNLVLDAMLEKNTKTRCWLAFTVYEILDDFIKAVLRNDRADVLEALGVKFFRIGSNNKNERDVLILLGSTPYVDDENAYAMSEETLRLFFEMKDKSTKCYRYITTYTPKTVTIQRIAADMKATREDYVKTYLESWILKLAIDFKDFDVVQNLMTSFEELNNRVISLLDNSDGGMLKFNNIIKGTYVIFDDGQYYSNPRTILGRVHTYPSDIIENLLLNDKLELAKEMIAHNKNFNEKIAKRINNLPNKDFSAYVLTDKEIERKLKLNSSEISDDEKRIMRSVNEGIINVRYLKSLRDIKFIKEILDQYYLNYYEFAYDAVSKNELKALFQVLVDNNYNNLVDELLKGKENYEQFLTMCWREFNVGENTEAYKAHKAFLGRQIKVDLSKYDKPHGIKGSSEKEAIKLGGNEIINLFKEEKDKVIRYVEEQLVIEKKVKADAEERARIVKGLTREYFEELLAKAESEIFIIKLCALFDAYLRFDYHIEGEDFAERMNKYFDQMSAADPKSREMDDGWGYMVPDTKYEEEVVVPAKNRTKHLTDIFNRLRMQRNNIAHSETRKVDELTTTELNECLDFVLPKTK